MAFKDINFNIALYGTEAVAQTTYPVVYTGDESSVKLNFTVTDEPDLSTATAKMHIYFADSSHIEKTNDKITISGTTISYTLTGTENDHAGIVRVDVFVTLGGATYTKAGYRFRIDRSLEASAPLVEYAVDTLDTVVAETESWLLQAQTDFGTAQDTRAAEWVADNDTRADEFTAAQTSRTDTFNDSEAARTSTFNTNETGRSNTFTTNENARQAAAEAGEVARDASYATAEANRDSQFDANESARSVAETARLSAESARVAAELARVTEYTALASDLTDTLAAADANIENFDIALQNGIIGENIAAELQNLETTYAPRLLSAEQQLEQIGLPEASSNGITTDTTGDATTIVNTFLTTLETANRRYAEFSQELTLTCANEITKNNVILTGNAEIRSNNKENYYRGRIAKNKRAYGKKVNQLPFIGTRTPFAQLKTAIGEARNIRVTVFGDSVSTSNGDILGATLTGQTAGQSEASPNGITYGEAYFNRLRDMLTLQFPTKTFDLYNRSIGGDTLDSWNTAKTFNSVSKTWIEHIKDTAPDVLIIGFGMNHSSFDLSAKYSFLIKSVTDYITANFATQPDIIMLTPPRPTLMGTSYGAFIGQSARQNVAESIRAYACRYPYYVADVNRLSNIKRLGVDLMNPRFKQVDVSNEIVLSGGATAGTNLYYINTSGNLITIPRYVNDFQIRFTLNVSSVTPTGEAIAINFNKEATSWQSNRLLIVPFDTDSKAKVQSYARYADGTNWGSTGFTRQYTDNTALSSKIVRIEKRDSVLEVYFNDVLVLRDILDVWNVPGNITIAKSGGSTVGANIYNLKYYEETYEDYLPVLTEEEMWGAYSATDTDTKQPYGGNGVNHPSSIGLEECYVPVLRELIDDMVRFVV